MIIDKLAKVFILIVSGTLLVVDFLIWSTFVDVLLEKDWVFSGTSSHHGNN